MSSQEEETQGDRGDMERLRIDRETGRQRRQRATGIRCDEEGGRDWNDAATSQGWPGASRSWKRQATILPKALGGSVALSAPCMQTFGFHTVTR